MGRRAGHPVLDSSQARWSRVGEEGGCRQARGVVSASAPTLSVEPRDRRWGRPISGSQGLGLGMRQTARRWASSLPRPLRQTDRPTPCLRYQQEVKNACGLSPARPRQVRCQERAPVPGRAPVWGKNRRCSAVSAPEGQREGERQSARPHGPQRIHGGQAVEPSGLPTPAPPALGKQMQGPGNGTCPPLAQL